MKLIELTTDGILTGDVKLPKPILMSYAVIGKEFVWFYPNTGTRKAWKAYNECESDDITAGAALPWRHR